MRWRFKSAEVLVSADVDPSPRSVGLTLPYHPARVLRTHAFKDGEIAVQQQHEKMAAIAARQRVAVPQALAGLKDGIEATCNAENGIVIYTIFYLIFGVNHGRR